MQLLIDYAPAYELVISLRAYLDRRGHKLLDLGAAWAARVQEQLSPELSALLGAADDRSRDPWLELLVWQCPVERDAAGFLRWFAALSAGAIYEHLAPYAAHGGTESLPPDLSGWRDRSADLLSRWNEEYFQHVDPAILTVLAADAEARRAQVDGADPMDVLEQATGGIRYEPDSRPERILLVPQHHFSPLNLFSEHRGLTLVSYAVELVPADPSAPGPGLLRMARALADESRLRMLRFLAGGTHSFTEVVDWSGLAKSTVHHHLISLRAAGLVRIHRTSGGTDRFSLRPDAVPILGGRLSTYLQGE